jgi:hypothetical protein
MMQPYGKHLYYKLYRALQDEGIADNEMAFEQEMTLVSDLGFVTLRFEQDIPQIVHFLVWPEKRTWHNSIHHYRDVKGLMIDLGFTSFIAAAPVGHKQFPRMFRLWGDKNLKPYAVKDGIQYYVIQIRRHLS